MCLDAGGRKLGDGIALAVFGCRFHGHERFSYTASGLIQGKQGCLSVEVATTGAALSLAQCDGTSNHEVFKLAR